MEQIKEFLVKNTMKMRIEDVWNHSKFVKIDFRLKKLRKIERIESISNNKNLKMCENTTLKNDAS